MGPRFKFGKAKPKRKKKRQADSFNLRFSKGEIGALRGERRRKERD